MKVKLFAAMGSLLVVSGITPAFALSPSLNPKAFPVSLDCATILGWDSMFTSR